MVSFFFASVVLKTKFSGNVAGNMHKIPSVSSSSGRPIVFKINVIIRQNLQQKMSKFLD